MGPRCNMTGVLCRKGGNLVTDMHTGRILCEDKGSNWSDAFTSQGTPSVARKPETRGEAW